MGHFLQVYILAMEQKKQKELATPVMHEGCDGPGESSGGGESLIQPEMKTLSKQWLAALKDHALLSLPTGIVFAHEDYFG